jgi:hypothetical protein
MEPEPPLTTADRPDSLGEALAERTHELWVSARLAQGWRHGPARNDSSREHPSLLPYAQLSEEEREVDRVVSSGVLDALGSMGYRVVPAGFDVFREYEFIAGSTQFLTERRQASSQTYLAINTAIFAIFGLLIKEAGLRDAKLAVASAPLIVAGLGACVVWFLSLRHYRALIGWRFDLLRRLEQHEAMRGSRKLYTHEWDDFLLKRGRRAFWFSNFEQGLPVLFAILFFCYLVAMLVVSGLVSAWT